MRQFSDLFPLIVPHVPGAPEPLIRAHCALAARQGIDEKIVRFFGRQAEKPRFDEGVGEDGHVLR